MCRYQYMFNSCRIPEVPADTFYTFDPKQNNHVAVVRKGKFYTFSLVNSKYLSISLFDEYCKSFMIIFMIIEL